MESLGERLRKGREEKNISLEEVARTTKISKSVLRALENDQYNSLPAPVFVRGFIRFYSRYAGLNEKELLSLYAEVNASKISDDSQEKEKNRKKTGRNKLLLSLILLTGLVILLTHLFFVKPSLEVKTVSEPQKKLERVESETPSPKEKVVIEERTSSPASIPIEMVVKCQAITWMEIIIDNGPPFEVTLFRGDKVSWEGEEKIELKIGNAGGIKMVVNGILLKPFGKPGEVVKLVFVGNTFSVNGGEPQNLEIRQEKEKKYSD
ncbi:MAG: helix-turn-helix domain-containing protein [Deltaproteobacteria bacterium]|nr:helix-turn-helix domain-containing protein [Deltaproteobacteria bacterium]